MRKCSDGALDSDGKNGGFITVKVFNVGLFIFRYSFCSSFYVESMAANV